MTKEDWQDFKEEINQEVIKPAKRSVRKNWKKWLGIGYLNIKTVLWMGYFLLAFIFYAYVFISSFLTYKTWYAWDLALLIINYFLLYAVCFYIYKPKPILSHKFFKLLFWINIYIFGGEIVAFVPSLSIHLPSFAFLQTNNLPPFTSLNEVLYNTSWYLPALYATFRLGFKDWPKQKENPSWAQFYRKPRRIYYSPRQIKRFVRDDVLPLPGTFARVKPIRID